MKNFKQIFLSIALCLCLCFGLTACAFNDDDSNKNSGPEKTTEEKVVELVVGAYSLLKADGSRYQQVFSSYFIDASGNQTSKNNNGLNLDAITKIHTSVDNGIITSQIYGDEGAYYYQTIEEIGLTDFNVTNYAVESKVKASVLYDSDELARRNFEANRADFNLSTVIRLIKKDDGVNSLVKWNYSLETEDGNDVATVTRTKTDVEKQTFTIKVKAGKIQTYTYKYENYETDTTTIVNARFTYTNNKITFDSADYSEQ